MTQIRLAAIAQLDPGSIVKYEKDSSPPRRATSIHGLAIGLKYKDADEMLADWRGERNCHTTKYEC